MQYKLESGLVVPKCGVVGVAVLVAGFISHLALGAFYSMGNFSPYFMSYLRNRTEDTDVRYVDSAWISGVGAFGACAGLSLGGLLAGRAGPRIAVLVGSVFFCGGYAVSYFSTQFNLILLVITYGLIVEFGETFAYGPPIQCAIRWFPTHPGLALGVIVGGFGGGALIFNQVITVFVNPDNLSPDLTTDDGEKYFTQQEVLDRVPHCFLLLAGIFTAMLLFATIVIHNPPTETKLSESVVIERVSSSQTHDTPIVTVAGGVDETTKAAGPEHIALETGQTEKPPIQVEKSPLEKLTHWQAVKLAVRTRSFYVAWFSLFCIYLGFQFVALFYKIYGQQFINDDHFLALVGSLASIFNCIGRPFWGVVMDRFGFKVTMRCISLGFAVLTATLQLTEYLHKGFYMAWICASYFTVCGIWVVMPSTLAKLFGVHNMAFSYGILFLGIAISSLTMSIVASTLKDLIGWHGIFSIGAGFIAIPFLLTFMFNGKDSTGKPI